MNLKNKILGEYGERKDLIVLCSVVIVTFIIGLLIIKFVDSIYGLPIDILLSILIGVIALGVSGYFTYKHSKEYSSYIQEFRGYRTDLNELLTKAGEIIEEAKKSIKIVTEWLGVGSVTAPEGHKAYIGSLYKKAAEEKVKKEYLFSICSSIKTDPNVFLFSVGIEIGEKLNKGTIPEELKNKLVTKDVLLPENPIVWNEEDKWVIGDEGKKETYCIVRKKDTKLNIYMSIFGWLKNIPEREKKNIPEWLKETFEENGCPLSKAAKISRVYDNEWEISAGKKGYIIIESKNLLKIYRKIKSLLSMDGETEEELNKGNIPNELKKELENRGVLIPENPIVRKKDDEWVICDEGKKETYCTIGRKEDKKLKIYENISEWLKIMPKGVKKKIPIRLKETLGKNKCPLSGNAKISRVYDNEWEISDRKKGYIIIESDNQLNIYKKGTFEITVITLPQDIARERTEKEFPKSKKRKPGRINEIVENDNTIGEIMKELWIKIRYHDCVQFHVFIVDDKKALFYMEEPVKENGEEDWKTVGYVTEDPRMLNVLIQMFKRMDEESEPYEWNEQE